MRPTIRAVGPLFVLLLGAVAFASWFSQSGEGDKQTQTRPVGSFTRIRLEVPLDLVVRPGPPSLTLTTDKDLLPLIEATVEQDTLVLRARRSIDPGSGKNLAQVTVPALKEVRDASSGDVEISGFGRLEELTLSTEDSGDVRFQGQAGKLAVAIDGSGDVTLAQGRADSVELTSRASGDLRARGFTAQQAQLGLSGSGDARLTLDGGEVKAVSTGSGDVELWGKAGALMVSLSGSGDLKAHQLTAQSLKGLLAGSGDLEGNLTVHDAQVNGSGSGDAELTLTGGKLQAALSGSGDLVWHGSAQVEAAAAGSGEVEHR